MSHYNIQNHVILEGLWGVGKTTVAKYFSENFSYLFVSEPTHLDQEDKNNHQDLQIWYRQAHKKQEAYLYDQKPCILERSILSVYAFEYALKNQLPKDDEMIMIRDTLKQTKTMLVYLAVQERPIDQIITSESLSNNIVAILKNKAATNRYHEFFEKILPWKFDIVPFVINIANDVKRIDARAIAEEIDAVLHAQRVSQINVVCIESGKDKRILVMHRVPRKGGFWQAITGGVHPGEGLREAALREIDEEIHLNVMDHDLIGTGFAHSFLGNDDYFLREYVFAAIIHETKKIHLSEEHDEYRWLPYDEAAALLKFENNKIALNHALESIKKYSPLGLASRVDQGIE